MLSMGNYFVNCLSRKILCNGSFIFKVKYSRDRNRNLMHESICNYPSKKLAMLWTWHNLNYLRTVTGLRTNIVDTKKFKYIELRLWITCQWLLVSADCCFRNKALSPLRPWVFPWLTLSQGISRIPLTTSVLLLESNLQ